MHSTIRLRRQSARRSAQRGVSIMFVLLGLVVAAAVTLVGYNQYSDSTRNARIEAAKSEIVGMISGAQKLYGGANQYGAVTTAIAVQSGVVPARRRIVGTNTAQNEYNGAIDFSPATITSPNDSLVLSYGNVRQSDCQDLVLGLESLTRRMAVGATVVKAADVAVDVAAMSSACDASAVSDISFTFGRGQ